MVTVTFQPKPPPPPPVDYSLFRWELDQCRCCTLIWCQLCREDRHWQTFTSGYVGVAKVKERIRAHWELHHADHRP